MNDQSFELFSKEYDANQKFDYFVCSVAGALFAYIGQTYAPHILNSWFYLITPIALLFLTLCFGCGFLVIHEQNYLTKLNTDLLRAHEECARLAQLLEKPDAHFMTHLGEQHDRNSIKAQWSGKIVEFKGIRKKAFKNLARAKKLATARNCLLTIGFALILLSKVLQPYYAAP